MASNDERWDDRQGFAPFLTAADFPPLSATVQVDVGACSHPGRGRTTNDDHYLVIRLGRHQETLRTNLSDEVMSDRFDEYGYGMAVADGVGNEGGGGATSHLAIATLVYMLRHFGKWNLRIDDQIAREVLSRAERFYRHIDSTVVHQRRTGAAKMDQTTLTATMSAGRDLFFSHVGHSRAYLLRKGQLLRLTRDHTIGKNGSTTVGTAPLVDVNVAARDLKHVITNTLGMRGAAGPVIDLERIHLEDDDRVLVCTNGLTDMVDERVIGEVLASDQSPDDQCQALVDQAMAAGGEDDATALVCRYRVPPSAEAPERLRP